MAQRWLAPLLVLFAIIAMASIPHAQTPTQPVGKSGDLELVEKLITARKDYQKTLEKLHAYYKNANDQERARWARDELVAFHRAPKHAFILDLFVPPPNLGDGAHTNVVEANNLFTWALQYKDKGYGTDYLDNQRRAELIFQDILNKYPQSDKISDVAFMLGDIYESKAYRQYYLAAEYYHRCYQWNKRTTHEARLRAARIYDRQLNNRARALELYKEITTHETDPRRKLEAQKRIAELSSTR